VVLLLLALWGTLLVSWLRSRTGGSFGDSVGTFRRHLTVLERAAPSTVRPANRMRVSATGTGIPPYRSFGAVGGSARRLSQPGRPGVAAPVGWSASPRSRPIASSTALRRRQTLKRRRDVFSSLLAAMLVSLVLFIALGIRAVLYVQVSLDVLFVAYVVLLIHLRNLAAERELKVTFMSQARPSRAASADRRPAYAPRRDDGYDTGAAGYGQLALRRAVN